MGHVESAHAQSIEHRESSRTFKWIRGCPSPTLWSCSCMVGGDGSDESGSKGVDGDVGDDTSGNLRWCPAAGGAGHRVAAGGIGGRDDRVGCGVSDGGGGGSDESGSCSGGGREEEPSRRLGGPARLRASRPDPHKPHAENGTCEASRRDPAQPVKLRGQTLIKCTSENPTWALEATVPHPAAGSGWG